MYLPAFPALARSLDTTPGAVQATLSTYLVGLALGQAIYGPLADRFGRRPPLVAGLLLYALASVGCALAPRIEALIALRFVQALGGSACLVIPRAIVRDRYDPQASARVYSQLMLVIGAAPILAPLVGGQIAALVGWRGIFALLAALGAVGLAMALVALPETRPPSAATAARAAGLADYARLLSDRRFMGFATCAGLAMAGMFAYISESPFVLIELYRIPAEAYGWVFGSNAAALIAASQLNVALVARWPPETVLVRALVASALLGVGLAAVAAAPGAPLALLLGLLLVYMGSRGFIQPNAVACAMAGHPQRAGSASALFGVLQFGGATAASVVVGLLHDGTARPMGLVVAGSGVLGLAAYLALARRGR
jgi:DHA1 family bicyclomycin/chloramphenicol resistance-like MFS transporter